MTGYVGNNFVKRLLVGANKFKSAGSNAKCTLLVCCDTCAELEGVAIDIVRVNELITYSNIYIWAVTMAHQRSS